MIVVETVNVMFKIPVTFAKQTPKPETNLYNKYPSCVYISFTI